MAELKELEDRIEKLKHSYDLFFSGIENIDPADKKVPIQRLISKLNEMHIKNPAIRFRFQSSVGRYVSLKNYWARILREIEEGRLTRGLFKTPVLSDDNKPKAFFGKEAPDMDRGDDQKKRASGEVGLPQERDRTKRDDVRSVELSYDDIDKLDHKRPLRGPGRAMPRKKEEKSEQANKAEQQRAPLRGPRPPMKKRTAQNAAQQGVDEKKVNRIYNDFISARKENGLSDNIRKESIKRQIDKQTANLRNKYKTEEIDFRVVKKDDKVVLRPVVKKRK